jgi:hypothetical protein
MSSDTGTNLFSNGAGQSVDNQMNPASPVWNVQAGNQPMRRFPLNTREFHARQTFNVTNDQSKPNQMQEFERDTRFYFCGCIRTIGRQLRLYALTCKPVGD